MTFRDIQDDILDRLNYNTGSTLQPNVRARIERTVNMWHRRLLSRPELTRLRDRVTTFTSVTTTAGYHTLPPAISRINRIYDPTNNQRLTDRSLDWLRSNPLSGSDTGTPAVYVPLGLQAVLLKPTSDGLWAASSSASDTKQTVSIQGIRSGGYPHVPAQQTLNGTTRVQIGSQTDYVDVLKFWVSNLCVGDITLYDANAAGNTLAVIPIGQLASRYYGFYLYPVPAAATEYTLEYMAAIPTLSAEHDEPMIPEDFHDILCAAGRYEELLIKEKETAMAVLRGELQPRIAELCSFVVNLPDTVIVPGAEDVMAGGSNLGSYYPAGRL